MEHIYNDYGIEVYKKADKYFLKYDAGELVVQMKEIEITNDEAQQIRSLKSSEELYEYLINNLNKRMNI